MWTESLQTAARRTPVRASVQALSAGLLAAGVAALVATTDLALDAWAQSHQWAAWLALWAVAALAMLVLRGVTRWLAQGLMQGLDAWSVRVARRRADERLWAMAQADARLMAEVQNALARERA
ncbi:MAG: hypothetical protein RIQ38_2251 [Pseudomonadota bacterium]|jgi:hypothetical protein